MCVSTDKIRPATPSETLAYLYLNKNHPSVDYIPPRDGDQQNYVDASRNVDETSGIEHRTEPMIIERLQESDTGLFEPVQQEPEKPRDDDVFDEFFETLRGAEEADAEPEVEEVKVHDPKETTQKRSLPEQLDDLPRAIRRVTPSDDDEATEELDLLGNWQRTGVEGPGVRLLSEQLQKRNRSRSRERQAFIAERVERVEVPKGTNKNVRKQMAGKNMVYDRADAATRKALDKSRAAEWKKWMDFDAGVVIQGKQLTELLDEGHSMLPTQWIETDLNEHLQRPGQVHIPETKSRLVACGQFENREGLRTDSPTAGVESLN